MTVVLAVLEWLVAHGPTLALGVTVVLVGGVAAMASSRDPVQRRRLGIGTALAVVVFLSIGIVPLPRLEPWNRGEPSPTITSATTAPEPDPRARGELLAATLTTLGLEPGGAAHDAPASQSVFPLPQPAGTPDAPRAVEPSPGLPWPLLFAGCYAAAVALLLLRTLVGHLRLWALLADCRPVPNSMLAGLDLPPRTRVRSTARDVRPFCAGCLRPVIVLPAALLLPERAAEAAAVLRHEAAHLRAGDAKVWTLLAWLCVPLFWHPLFWWLCRQVRFCSELLADDDAAGAGGRERYARALLDLAERADATVAATGTVAVFHRPSEFYRRIQMLLQRQRPLPTSTSRLRRTAQVIAMGLLTIGASSLFGVPVVAQDPQPHALQRENTELRATIELLRTELATLRAQAPAPRAPAAGQPSTAQEPPEPDRLASRQGAALATAPALPPSPASSVTALAELTSRYVDLQAEIEVQAEATQETVRLAQAGMTPTGEAKRAQVTLRALERKLAICRHLIDGEIDATKAELRWLQQRRSECSPTELLQLDVQTGRAKTRLDALLTLR